MGIVSDCQGRKRAEVLSLECLPGLEIGGKPGVVLLLLCVNRNQLRCFSLVPSLWSVFVFFQHIQLEGYPDLGRSQEDLEGIAGETDNCCIMENCFKKHLYGL